MTAADPASLITAAINAFVAGRDDESENACRRLLTTAPDHADALNILGMIAARRGQAKAAHDLFARAVRSQPGFGLAWMNLAQNRLSRGLNTEAIDAFHQVLALDPASVDALNGLGSALAGDERYDEAAEAFRAALAIRPDVPALHANLAAALQDAQRPDEALAAYEAALRLDPANPITHFNLAGAHAVAGRKAETLDATGRALQLDPALGQAWYLRSQHKTFSADDPEIGKMVSLTGPDYASSLTPQARMDLGFALGKAFQDTGDAERAAGHLAEANRLTRATLDYNVAEDERGFEALAGTFDAAFLDRHAGAGDPSDAPVFVLGMPRSGTTLVEQIIASHPDVYGAGELSALEDLIAEDVGEQSSLVEIAAHLGGLTDSGLRALGHAYLDRALAGAPAKARMTDKMPGNFRFVGLIRLILPNARIVHCQRDPMDTCFSCWSIHFSGRQDFAYDLTELGRFYRAYDVLMAHWRTVVPADRLLEVRYEDVVGDLEGQARRLIAFCGLPWSPDCLGFFDNARPVRTASAAQVRQPIYRTSMQRWRPYERHLGPLIEALGPAASR